jgi:uncharacterized caspase-like protein
MKNNFLLALILILGVFVPQASIGQETSKGAKKFAVVVGVSTYRMSSANLRYADDDAYRYYAYLKSCKGGCLDDDQMAVLVDEAATRDNILKTMREIFSKAGPDDMVIFFFSGHGSNGLFCPYDITENGQNILSHDDIRAVFKASAAKTKIVLADACHSGSIASSSSNSTAGVSGYNKTDVVIIMSSTAQETSQEDPQIRQGAFTYYLLKGLKGSADKNHDKRISLEELFPYIKANVKNLTNNRQTPIIEGNANRQTTIGYLQ